MDAFCSLLKTHPYDQLKTVDIIRESGVSHQTFYRLFVDKDDLAKAFCLDDFSRFFSIYGTTASWKEIVMSILRVIQQKSSTYRHILLDPIGESIVEHAMTEISENYSGLPCSKATVSIWMCVLREWAKQHFKDSPEQAYKNLLYHLPVSDVLTADECDAAIARYEQTGADDYKVFRSFEERHK
jgi:hypothetical protein